MGWAERWAKAKENHERSRDASARGKVLMLGLILAGVCGASLYSDTKHQITGRSSTATVMEHIKQCTVEYQRIGEEKREEQWPCELAEEIQQRVGKNKFKISNNYVARVQFPLQDGRIHEASVDDIKLGTYKLAIGTTVPVVYAPGNPGDVRAVMSLKGTLVWLSVFAAGLGFIALALGGPLMNLFRWAFGGTRAGEATAPSEPLAPTSTRTPQFGAPRTSFGMRKRFRDAQ